jgi:hypothetical protein
MELQQSLELRFDVDAVLRGQGADAARLRARRPALVRAAEAALQEGLPLLRPKVVYREFAVRGVKHERLLLGGGSYLESRLLVRQLASASRAVVILAAIGDALEKRVAETWEADMIHALALDGVGSAAVEALANAACLHFEQQAAERGWQASIPLSPGMADWPVETGQPQIFGLLGEETAGVRLTPGCVMIPRKSLTMLMGFGAALEAAGRTCDYCAMRATCRYTGLSMPAREEDRPDERQPGRGQQGAGQQPIPGVVEQHTSQ